MPGGSYARQAFCGGDRRLRSALLGSAIVAVEALAFGDASASGIELAIGGRYLGAAGGVVGERLKADGVDDNLRGYVFKQDIEIYFLGETTLDNGLSVGLRVELEGQTSGDQINAVYAYLSANLGEVRFGDFTEAANQLCYLVPSASEIFGADSPSGAAGFSFVNPGVVGQNGTNGTCYRLDDKATKLAYFTPVFAGFQFALTFAPDDTEDTRNTVNGAATRSDRDSGQNSENLSVAVNFSQAVDSVVLVLGGGATWSFDKESHSNRTDNASSYNAYGSLSYAGITLGAAMQSRRNFDDDGADQVIYGAGLTYEWQAWTVGLGWTHGDYEVSTGPAVRDDDLDYIALTASYEFGPGMSVDGVIEYADDAGRSANNDEGYRGLGAGVGVVINF